MTLQQASRSPSRSTRAESFLSRLMTNKMPRTGRIILTPMLNPGGKLIGDFTIAHAGEDSCEVMREIQIRLFKCQAQAAHVVQRRFHP